MSRILALSLAAGLAGAMAIGGGPVYPIRNMHVGWQLAEQRIPGGTPVPSKGRAVGGPTGIAAARRAARKRRNKAMAKKRGAE